MVELDAFESTILSRLGEGVESAVKGKDLAKSLGEPNDRKIRLAIRSLIGKGIPVASSVSGEHLGYYLVRTAYEANEYLRVTRERVIEDCKRMRDFKLASQDIRQPAQLKLGMR